MTRPVLVLVHGWGCDSRTWQPVLDGLRELVPVQLVDLPGFGNTPALGTFSLPAVLAAIESQLPERCVLLGWSLGAMLAVQLAARLPQQVLGVISLAANARFVASDDYPHAMAPDVNRQFNSRFAEQPQAALKMFTGLLAQGDGQERALLKQLRTQVPDAINHNWAQALQLLAELDNRAALAQLSQPLLHLLAEQDALVPIAAAESLRGLNSQHQIHVIAGSAHAVHWSQPQQLISAVQDFYETLATAVDKKRVAQSFGKAAATYDSVAGLQRAVGAQLLDYLPAQLDRTRLLDIGSGTGFFTAQLATRGAEVIALDIAQGMLEFARQQHPQAADWVCGDAENLPFAQSSVDFIFSSLAIQWCARVPQLMQELARVLKPGGRAYISTLGPGTLVELKRAWQQVDNYVHVNRFVGRTSLEQAVQQAGMQCLAFVESTRRLYFSRLRDLTHELKALGAHNINPGQAQGLTGRQRLQAFSLAYERERRPQGLPASYEVYYLVLCKP